MITIKDIKDILREIKNDGYTCFTSEAQLRDLFAIKLHEKFSEHTVIMPEYTEKPPQNYGLDNELIHFDLLVVDEEGKYTLFEFKYKTKASSFTITPSNLNVNVTLHEQSDTTNGRYQVWKDIYRIECFSDYPDSKVSSGYFIFITNSPTYYAEPRTNSVSYDFSISEGIHNSGERRWNCTEEQKERSVHKQNRSPLNISNEYDFQYEEYSSIQDTNGNEHIFKQLVVPIYSSNYLEKQGNDLDFLELLRSVGINTFINYYDNFKTGNAEAVKNQLNQKNYTRNSLNTKVYAGIKLFSNNSQKDALNYVIHNAKRVSQDIKNKAQELLSRDFAN